MVWKYLGAGPSPASTLSQALDARSKAHISAERRLFWTNLPPKRNTVGAWGAPSGDRVNDGPYLLGYVLIRWGEGLTVRGSGASPRVGSAQDIRCERDGSIVRLEY